MECVSDAKNAFQYEIENIVISGILNYIKPKINARWIELENIIIKNGLYDSIILNFGISYATLLKTRFLKLEPLIFNYDNYEAGKETKKYITGVLNNKIPEDLSQKLFFKKWAKENKQFLKGK